MQRLMIHLGTVDCMDGRPIAVYINGKYWGLYNLREKLNPDYVTSHYGVDSDDVTLIVGNGTLVSGNQKDWMDFLDFCKNNDFSDPANYELMKQKLDVESYVDYVIGLTYFHNTDSGNIRFWKTNDEHGLWRPMMFDFDWGLFISTYKRDSFEAYFNPAGHGVSDYFKSYIQCALIENPEFCDYFIKRYAYILNEVFTEEYVTAEIDKAAKEIEHEIVYNIERWKLPQSYQVWQNEVETLKRIAIARRQITVSHLKVFFNIDDATMRKLFPWFA